MQTNMRIKSALVVLASLAVIVLCSSSVAQVTTESPSGANGPIAGRVDLPLSGGVVVANPVNEKQGRAIIDISLPSVLDSVRLDIAELVLMASTVYDTTDPLLVAVVPVTDRSAAEQIAEIPDWRGNSDGTDMEYITLTSANSTTEGLELRLDITAIVELWQNGVIPNRGVVVRALSEERSTFQWTRTGAYDGEDARLEIMYSRNE